MNEKKAYWSVRRLVDVGRCIGNWLATSCNVNIQVLKRKKIEGWARKPKGLFQVLWEIRWLNGTPKIEI